MSNHKKFMTRFFLSLILLASTIKTQVDGEEDEAPGPSNALRLFRNQLKSKIPFCSPGLLNAYGLNGLLTPVNQPTLGWMFCPTMNNTCCSTDDAISAFAIIKGGLKNLKMTYTVYRNIISDFIEQLIITRDIATRVNQRMVNVRFSNCKVLTSKIILFDIDLIGSKLLNYLDRLYVSMVMTYKGFYCEICDAEKTKYIFDSSSFMVVNKRQCRETVQTGLKPMYFLRILILSLGNMVTKFLLTCDARGTYFDDLMSPQLSLWEASEDKLITKCWKQKNSPKWIEDCKEFCDQFNFVKVNEFFRPFSYKFIVLTEMYKKRNLQMVSQEALDPNIDNPTQTGTSGLMDDLVETKVELKFLNGFDDEDMTKAELKAQMIIAKLKNSNVITSITGTGNPIDENVVLYMEKGLNFFISGRKSLISTSDSDLEVSDPLCDVSKFTVDRLDNGIDKLADTTTTGISVSKDLTSSVTTVKRGLSVVGEDKLETGAGLSVDEGQLAGKKQKRRLKSGAGEKLKAGIMLVILMIGMSNR